MSRKLFQYHPTIGYHFIPGLKARVDHEGGGYLVRVNAAGFRCEHEFVREKTAGTIRALLFGDSFTAGDGVSNKDRFGDVLERMLPGLEVYNFGLSGTGTDQQYLTWREFAPGLAHDLVIIAVQVENIGRVAAGYRAVTDEAGKLSLMAKPYFRLAEDGALLLEQVPVPKEPIQPEDLPPEQAEQVDWVGQRGHHAWLRKAVNTLVPGLKDLAQRFSGYQALPVYDDPQQPAWKLLKAILLRWAAEASKPVVLFLIPLYSYVEESSDPSGYQARFAELRGTAGLTLHDPLDDLRQYPRLQRRGFRFERDAHPSPAGHRALAASLAKLVGRLMDSRGVAEAR